MIFVVGSSRSGTTMMGRIMGLNPEVYTCQELHFFEQLWDGNDSREFAPDDASRLAARLIAVQRDGYLSDPDPEPYLGEAGQVLLGGPLAGPAIFERVLAYEAGRLGRSIACDHTPRNVFYIREILEHYPRARVVNMVRDPRDVLLSQKRKWRRRYLGASGIPLREVVRSWINYHPITVAHLWRGSVRAAERWSNDPRVITIRFEDLLTQPEEAVRSACRCSGVAFAPSMLEVAVAGSSFAQDLPEQRGVDASRAQRWRRGGLKTAEVQICERIAGSEMQRHGYRLENLNGHPMGLALQYGSFPVKLGLALPLNVGRMRNPLSAIRRRLHESGLTPKSTWSRS